VFSSCNSFNQRSQFYLSAVVSLDLWRKKFYKGARMGLQISKTDKNFAKRGLERYFGACSNMIPMQKNAESMVGPKIVASARVL